MASFIFQMPFFTVPLILHSYSHVGREAGRDMEVILSAASIVKSFKLEQESVNCDSSSKTGQESSFCHHGACKTPICVQSGEGLRKLASPSLTRDIVRTFPFAIGCINVSRSHEHPDVEDVII